MKRKRVLFIMPSLSGGGAEKVLIDILRYTDYSLCEVDLCLILNKGVYLNKIPIQVKYSYVYNRNERLLYKLHFFLAKYLDITCFQSYRIRSVINKDYDTIVSFMEGIPVRFHNYLLSRGDINVSWVHTDLFANHYTGSYFRFYKEKSVYKMMDRIGFVSDDAKKNFIKLFDIQKQLATIYNPIDRKNIVLSSKENIIDKNKFTICCVGRLVSQKSYDRVVRLAYNLKKNGVNVDFWILGTGCLEMELRRLTLDLDVKDMIHFLGFQSNPYPYIASADLFLCTSQAEGYPLSICEALCLGKPIVSTSVTGPKEILGDSEFGLLSEQDDNSIYQNVMKMITDEKLMESFAEKARLRSESFNIKKVVNEIYKFILK